MKHIIAAGLIGAGVASGAWAQSSVTLYGSLDAGIAYISNSGGHAKWMEEQGNMQPDRWGIRAVEDLGGGLQSIVVLENGFYTNTGPFVIENPLRMLIAVAAAAAIVLVVLGALIYRFFRRRARRMQNLHAPI